MQSLVLGTAQWGFDYGITNSSGRISTESLSGLVAAAEELGLNYLDTASVYGDSQARIGQLAPGFEVQTKVNLAEGAGTVRNQVLESSKLLKRTHLWGVLAHDWSSADSGIRYNGARQLAEVLEAGLASRVGVSVYEEFDLLELLAIFPDVGVVQVPVSALDQRLVNRPVIAELRERGVRIQARSVLLQGLLTSEELAATQSRPELNKFRETARELGMSPLTLALNFVRSQDWIDELLVAPTTAAELYQIHSAWASSSIDLEWQSLATKNLNLIDPRRWR